jgi:hypothetical protein
VRFPPLVGARYIVPVFYSFKKAKPKDSRTVFRTSDDRCSTQPQLQAKRSGRVPSFPMFSASMFSTYPAFESSCGSAEVI